MATITVTFQRMTSFVSNEKVMYRLMFKESFDGIIKDENGDYVESSVAHVDVQPSYLHGVVMSQHPAVGILYQKRKDAATRNNTSVDFGTAELSVIFRDATFDIERTKFVAGEEYTTSDGETFQHEFDGYNTNIVEIHVSDKVQKKLDEIEDKVLGF